MVKNLIELFKKAIQNNQLLEIYSFKDDESFDVGKVLKLDEDNQIVTFQTFDSRGLNSGIWFIKIEHVSKIVTDSIYLRDINQIIGMVQDLKLSAPFGQPSLAAMTDLNGDFSEILRSIAEKKCCCKIVPTSSDDEITFLGYVTNLEKETLSFRNFDKFGQFMESMVIDISEVYEIGLATDDCFFVDEINKKKSL